MGKNFAGRDLSGKDFSGKRLVGANFRGATLDGASFEGADLRGVKLQKASLQGARFDRARLGRSWTARIVHGLFGSAAAFVLMAIAVIFLTVMFALPFDATESLEIRIGWAVGAFLTITALAVIAKIGPTASAVGPILIAVAVAVAFAFAGAGAGAVAEGHAIAFQLYVSWRVRKQDERFELVRSFSVLLASLGGTSFRGADLNGASFRDARLAGASFADADIRRVDWTGAQRLENARLGKSILRERAVRDLLVSRNGRGQSYEKADLRGANLNGADLADAVLKQADLGGASLQEADLTDANLRDALCTAADFTEAKLSGACLEAWNIDAATVLTDVDCTHVYLREEPDAKGNRERRPAQQDRAFEPGEFEQLYRKMVHTIEILLKDGISPDGARRAFTELQEKHPDVTFEKFEKREKGFIVGLGVPKHDDKGAVEHDLRTPWENERQLMAQEIRLLRGLKDEMKEVALAAAASSATAVIGGSYVKRERTIEGGVEVVNSQFGSLTGDVSDLAQSMQRSGDPQTAELGRLIAQLQQEMQQAQLSESDKQAAQEQLGKIAVAGRNPSDKDAAQRGRTAARILKGLVEGLPSAASLAESAAKILDKLAKTGVI